MRWSLKPKSNIKKIQALQEALNVDSVIASLLVQRGIETYNEAKQFFRPNLKDLHDPFLMQDMDKAIDRIEKAIVNDERVLVYGDYDVDGTTSVALVYSYLKTRTKNVSTYIPDRYTEGYGVSQKGIDYASDNNITLIIALDCGIKAINQVEYANENKIDFIICDHHTPGEQLPNAIAVLDPKRSDCKYPYKELCGCGIGFKVIQALSIRQEQPIETLTPYLDLVVTAIGADIVPITGENRILAYHGLKQINSQPRISFKTILKQIKKGSITITDVVFIIAPRINAAGRIKHGNHAVSLLVETDENLAVQFALDIEKFNTERRQLDRAIAEEALQQIEANNEQDCYTTVVYDEDWHKGVIGIVASRLIETHYKPTVVFTKSNGVLAGSVRSVKGFNIYKALEACSDYIEQFGGHKYAAGLTIKEDNYNAFKDQFEKIVSNTIEPSMRVPELLIDTEIDLDIITPKFYRILKQFAPFGPENRTPVFMTSMIKDNGYGKCVGENGKHLKVMVSQKENNQINGIGFNLGEKYNLTKNQKPFTAAYSVDENTWNGNTSLQLKLRDIK